MWFLIGAITFLVYYLYRYFVNRNQLFKNLGIPGPEPQLFWGNLNDVNFAKDGPQKIQEWSRKFGKIYGYFLGGRPVVVTSDLNILQEVLVKKFNVFHGRSINPLIDENNASNVNVFTAHGLRWKRLRSIANPAFSVTKLKEMIPVMQDSIDNFIERIDGFAQIGTAFDIFPVFKGLTIDIIGRIALGQQESLQDQNPWLDMTQQTNSAEDQTSYTMYLLASILPELNILWTTLTDWRVKFSRKFSETPTFEIIRKLENEIEDRRTQKTEHMDKKDFIQLFLNAEVEEGSIENADFGEIDTKALKVSKKLTPEEILSQCTLFLIAGFETTANTLGYATYLLATNPKIQQKLFDEIHEICGDEEITYEMVQKLAYLNNVFKETLRLYPLATLEEQRTSTVACDVGGYLLPAGTTVVADVWSVHYSREIWGDDANEFKPER